MDLIQTIFAGVQPQEEQQFSDVVSQFEAPLLRYAARLLNDSDAAQDVVQETFIKLHRVWSKEGGRPVKEMRGWLYRVTHNNAVDYIRKESRIRLLHQRQEEYRKMAAMDRALADKKDKLALVLDEVQKLDATERQVLLLRIQEGLSYREISQATQRSEGNIGCILHHAVKKLSRRINNLER